MRILPQPLPDIRLDPIKGINIALAALTDTDLAIAIQIRPDRLTVKTSVTGNRRQRPPLFLQCVNFHVFFLCDHQEEDSSHSLGCFATTSMRGVPPRLVDPQGEDFQ